MADMIFSDRSALQPSPGSGDGWRIGPQTGKAVDSALQAVSLAILVWLLAACGGADTAPDDGVPTYDQFEAPAELARLAWTPVVGYDGAADDFLLRGDTLVLLDTRVSEISVLVRSPAAPGKGARGEIWRRSGSFGRRGNGPGEFRQPRGLAWAPDGSFWTWDESNRLNRFTTGGELREELRPAFPCPLFRSSVAAAGGELFVAGNCADGAAASDTVYARAFIVASDATAREVASAPVLTGDFRFGSIMTAPRLIVEGRDDVLFATGLDACLTRLGSSPAAADTNARRCFTPPARYRSPAPELLEEFRFPNGAQPKWPDPITPLFAHFGDETRYIAQLISEDSLVITPWARNATPLVVAPTKEFVSCRAGYCLWFDANNRRLSLLSERALGEGAQIAGSQ